MDLTLRDGVNLQDAIVSAKQIDEQSKVAGFYLEVLDHVARQSYGNASFEVEADEGGFVEEFFTKTLLMNLVIVLSNKSHLIKYNEKRLGCNS